MRNDLREPHMLPSNNPKKWGVKVINMNVIVSNTI